METSRRHPRCCGVGGDCGREDFLWLYGGVMNGQGWNSGFQQFNPQKENRRDPLFEDLIKPKYLKILFFVSVTVITYFVI